MAGIEHHPAAAATTIEDIHTDLLIRIIGRMDGPALAAASCATTHLRSLATHPDLWRDLCSATWPSLRLIPSLPTSHRSFFSDAHPFPCPAPAPATSNAELPAKLVSAVDLHHKGIPIISRVVETDASTPWFRGSPFRIDALDTKDPLLLAISPKDLTLSWVVIDPVSRRAVNASSRVAVAVERHWYTGATLVRFATVVGDGDCAVEAVVTCSESGHVREISLTVEDMEGMYLNGRDSLVVLKRAIEGGRSMKEGEAEHMRRRYGDHVRRRQWLKERKLRREGMIDLCCSVAGVALFLPLLFLLASRCFQLAA